MLKKIFITFLLLSGIAYGETKDKEMVLTAVYPAPYGDYESLRSNTFEIFNVISNADPNKVPTSIEDFRPIYVNKSLKIYGSIVGPYAETINIDPNNAAGFGSATYDFIDINAKNNRIMFGKNGGLFSENNFSGLIFNTTSKVATVRNQGDIYLQPNFNEKSTAAGNYGFVAKPGSELYPGDPLNAPWNTTTTLADGKVIIQGHAIIEGNAVVGDTLYADNIISRTGNGVVIDDVLYVRKIVTNEVEVVPTIDGLPDFRGTGTIAANNLQVRTIQGLDGGVLDTIKVRKLEAQDYVKTNVFRSFSSGTGSNLFYFKPSVGDGSVVIMHVPSGASVYDSWSIRFAGRLDDRYKNNQYV